MSEDVLNFIPTRCSNANKQKDFVAVNFTSYKKTAKPHNAEPSHKMQETENDNTFNMKLARHEIVKLGMSGFDPQKKEEAKVQLAVSLGAKPRRNKYKNYKQLLQEKKEAQKQLQSRLDLQQLGKNQAGKSTAKGKGFDRKRKKQKSDLLESYGKVKLKKK